MAIVKKYNALISSIQKHTDGVYTLELKSLEKPFKFDPGQFLHLTLDQYDPSGHWPESRCFSMQSAPDQNYVRITYSVKGIFTSRMEKELKKGSVVTIKLPYGDLFTKPHNKDSTIFIAGGTGITPFLSLFNHKSFAEYRKPVLYEGFRNHALNIYNEELELAKQINAEFRIVTLYENMDGVLDINKIYLLSSKFNSFFISGPPVMIKKFKSFLLEKGIDNNQIGTDDWG